MRVSAPTITCLNARPAGRIAWIEARSITNGAGVFVPAAYCLLGYPSALQERFPVPDSSGLAAGTDVETCVGRGLLELIERDAVSIWWYGRVPRPECDLDRRQLPVPEALETWMKRSGRRLWLLDLTHDLRVPVVAAVSSDVGGRNLRLFGFAASWTMENAARSALGELTQFEATKRLASAAADSDAPNFVKRCGAASIDEWPFIRPSAEVKAVAAAALDGHGPVAWAELLRRCSLELYSSRSCPRGLPLAAVRVIVPGLRHVWPRFAAGRLYDVPFDSLAQRRL